MISRRLPIVALLAAALLMTACGSDDTTTSQPATTQAPLTTEGVDDPAPSSIPGVDDPATTTPEVPFDEGVSQLRSAITAAGNDACKLIDILGSLNIEDPTTPAQVQSATEVTTDLMTAIADSAPPELAAAAEKIRSGLAAFRSGVEGADYSVEAFQGFAGNQDLGQGINEVATAAQQNCG